MRFGKLAIPALLILTSAAFAQDVDTAAFEAAYRNGKALFEQQDYQNAYPKLVAAFKANPGNADVNFLLGRTAFELGDYESAVMAFERVLIMNPGLHRAKLELARSYYRLGVHEMAKIYFQEVLDTGPPEAVQRNIHAFLDRIEKARKQHLFSGVLTLAGHYDTNPRVAPSNTAVQTATQVYELDPDSREVSDSLFSATLALNHQYKFDNARYSWKTTGLTYHSLYNDEHDLDINYYSLTSGFSIESEKYVLDIQGVYEHLEKEYEAYLRTTGGQINFLQALSQNVYLALGTRVLDKEYKQDPKRDALNISLTGGPIMVWGPNRITTRVGFETEDASAQEDWEEDEYSYDRYWFSFRYDRRLPARFTVFVGYKFEHSDYDARYAAFDQYRHDRIHEVMAGIRKNLTESTSIELSHTYTEARSSIELYRYDRHVTSLSISMRF